MSTVSCLNEKSASLCSQMAPPRFFVFFVSCDACSGAHAHSLSLARPGLLSRPLRLRGRRISWDMCGCLSYGFSHDAFGGTSHLQSWPDSTFSCASLQFRDWPSGPPADPTVTKDRPSLLPPVAGPAENRPSAGRMSSGAVGRVFSAATEELFTYRTA